MGHGIGLDGTGFNPRACVRRDLCDLMTFAPANGFNPRACVRRDRTTDTD